jgi:uncharacterized protein (TIGR00251 family)
VVRVKEVTGGVTFAARVQPRAKRNAVVGDIGEAVKIALTAPPVEGRANEACVEFLAELLGVARGAVTIISGETSRNKVVQVAGVTAERVIEKLSNRGNSRRQTSDVRRQQ